MSSTWFIDIDATLIKTKGNILSQGADDLPELLPGTLEKLKEIHEADGYIILTTGRPISLKEKTLKMLEELNIIYNDIIFNLPRGKRVLINDHGAHGEVRAIAYALPRNVGISEVEV